MPTAPTNPPQTQRRPGLIFGTLELCLRLLGLLFASLLLSILLEFVGMLWFWPDQPCGLSATMGSVEHIHRRILIAADEAQLCRVGLGGVWIGTVDTAPAEGKGGDADGAKHAPLVEIEHVDVSSLIHRKAKGRHPSEGGSGRLARLFQQRFLFFTEVMECFARTTSSQSA